MVENSNTSFENEIDNIDRPSNKDSKNIIFLPARFFARFGEGRPKI